MTVWLWSQMYCSDHSKRCDSVKQSFLSIERETKHHKKKFNVQTIWFSFFLHHINKKANRQQQIKKQKANKMVKEMSFTVVNNVLDSWESLKRKKNYEREAGIRLFQKYVLVVVVVCCRWMLCEIWVFFLFVVVDVMLLLRSCIERKNKQKHYWSEL